MILVSVLLPYRQAGGTIAEALDSVEHLGGGRTRATARVAARDAGWLKGDEKDLTVSVAAP